MGKEVVYCFNCGVRLLRVDFERGAAFKIGSECTCNDCLPELLALLPPKERVAFQKSQANQEIKAAPRRGTGRVPMADRSTRKITSTRIRARAAPKDLEAEEEEEKPSKADRRRLSRMPLVLLGAGGALVIIVLIVLIVLLATRKGPAEKPPDTEAVGAKPAAPKTEPAPEAPTYEEQARLALEKAREYKTQKPGDYDGQLQMFLEVAMRFDKTPASEEARKEAEAVREKIAKGMTPRMEELLEKIKGPREQEEYQKILDMLDKAKDEDPKPAWILQVDKQIDEVKSELEKKHAEVVQKAKEAKEKGEKEEIARLRERLTRWGVARLLEEFNTAFEAPPADSSTGTGGAETPVPKGIVRNEEGKAYLEKWMTAVVPATRRDYEAAIARVEQAAQGLNEETWKQEAAEDVRDLKAAADLYKAAMKEVGRIAPGQIVSLETVSPSGARETVQGVVTLADADHLEVRREGQKTVTFVDPAEISASSLARIAREAGRTRGAELRAAMVLMLLEGETEPAKQLGVEVPEKYWDYAKTARERAPAIDSGAARKEREAKFLFWGAGKDFLKMETMGTAIEKYKLMARDYVDTAIIQKNIALVTRRSVAGKEYFILADDIKGSGAVKRQSHPELKSCWTCQEDVGHDPAKARETYVEIEFWALPQTAYQCWVFAGACCEETFITYLQATDMTGPNPRKTSEKIPYDVGGPVAAPVNPKVKGLKKTHAQHGGEKQASRWEWIAIPLPKYPSGGLKKIRLMTENKGFSVGAALVTSLRKAPPKDDELREDFKRALDEMKERPREKDPEAGIAAHWKLDEEGTASARDFSGQGNSGTIKGNPKSVTGKIGKAIEFDGNDDVIEIAGNPVLQKLQEGSYTICAWFNPKDVPSGSGSQNRANYGIVTRPGYHEGLKYTSDKRFHFEHWLVSNDPKKPFQTNTGTWNETYEPGQWYHVAAVVDANSRTLSIYVNGKLKATSKPWDQNAKGRDYGNAPWRIGHANPGAREWAWPAKGAIDDVRIYSRALSAQEIQVIYGSGMAGLDQ